MTFSRRLTLDIGNARIKHDSSASLRVSFSIERDKSRDPNSAEIQIYNLAPSTRSQLSEKPRVACRLSAGYDGSEADLFLGVLLHVVHVKEGTDWITSCLLGDEDESRTALRRIHRTFPKGTPNATVLSELVKATGLKQGNTGEASVEARLIGKLTLPRPWLATGSALGELNAFARSLGFDWTIQDGAVLFTGLSAGTAGTGPLISAATGLEATPSVDADGIVTATSRLIGDLVPGRPFQLDSQAVSGLYIAQKTKHVGDTHGAEWSVTVEGVPFAAQVKKGLIVNGA